MSKARDLADFVSAGNPLADGTIDAADINGLTASASELNILDGATVTTAEINYSDVTTLGTVEASKVVTADASGDVKFPDGDILKLGTDGDLQFQHNGLHSYISDAGTGNLYIQTSAGLIVQNSNGTETMATFTENGASALYYDNTSRLSTTSVGADVTGELIADSYNESYTAVTSTSNATTVNCEAGNTFMHTLTENTTFTFSNPPASGTAYTMTIEIIQDAGASGYTVTWPTSVDWPSATAPTLTATASAVDVFVFTTRDGGTTWYGFTAGQALG